MKSNGKVMLTTVVLSLIAAIPLTAPKKIKPRDIWLDDRGKQIQAHGGGVIKLGDVYYWFGEDRSMENDPDKRYVSCYSSQDLVHWKFRNQVVKLSDPENLGPNWVLERPKVFYNTKSKKYVMYAHIDDKTYRFAHVAVFICDVVDGNYGYLNSFRPLGHESRDIGQFIDDDNSAYLIFEDRPAKGFHIAKLSDDYLTVEKELCFIRVPLEGGALVHFSGLYYAIGSALTGWKPNPNKYATAKNLAGPWSEFRDIAPAATNTYGAQSTMIFKVVGTKATTIIFMADIWKPEKQWDSRYLWMPLQMRDGQLWLPEPRPWSLNVKTGEARIED